MNDELLGFALGCVAFLKLSRKLFWFECIVEEGKENEIIARKNFFVEFDLLWEWTGVHFGNREILMR